MTVAAVRDELLGKASNRTPACEAGCSDRLPILRADPVGSIQTLQRVLGNDAIERTLQAKSASGSTDRAESEADAIADRVVASGGRNHCDCEPAVQAPGLDLLRCPGRQRACHVPASDALRPRASGRPLDPPVRSDMESHFGRDFGGVRVHTDDRAGRNARAVDALAYTIGTDIVFASGRYDPSSGEGRRLIAHELTHVVQQSQSRRGMQRKPDIDPRTMSITREQADSLSDSEIDEQIALLQDHIRQLAEGDPERDGARTNLDLLRGVQVARALKSAGVSGDIVGTAPRPPGLPDDGAYTLAPAPAELQFLATMLSEGQVYDVVLGTGAGPASEAATEPGAPLGSPPGRAPELTAAGAPAATMGLQGIRGVTQAVMRTGYAPAGPNSIVIIAQSSWPRGVPEYPPLGHTAVGVRVDGTLQAARGFNPRMAGMITNMAAVSEGRVAVPAQITSDLSMLGRPGTVTVEFPVTQATAQAALRGLPPPGPVESPLYTARPAIYEVHCPGGGASNCVLKAVEIAERAIGQGAPEGAQPGRIGRPGGPPIADIPQPRTGSQGEVMKFVRDVARTPPGEAPPVAELPGTTGPAVAGRMSTGFKILVWGGRVMLVAGIVSVGLETYFAPPEQRTRTFVGASAGLAGSLLVGTLAVSLLCGPAALVCMLVTGLAAGFIGYHMFRGAAEGIYDFAHNPNSIYVMGNTLFMGPYGPYGMHGIYGYGGYGAY